jgi:hypothetical protein
MVLLLLLLYTAVCHLNHHLRDTATFLGAYSRLREEDKTSKKMYSVLKTWQKEGIELSV